MPTLNTITRQVELTADVASKFFRTDFQKSAKSILITGSLDTAANFMSPKGLFATADDSMLVKDPHEATADDSILINGPIDTAADMVKSKFGLRSNVSEKLGNYAEERDNFNSEFDKNMSSLRQSANRLEINLEDKNGALSALKEFADFEIPPEETEQVVEQQIQAAQNYEMHPVERFENFVAEYLTAETSNISDANQNPNATRDAVSDVRNFVKTFNSTVDYLNENRGVSNRMNTLATNFGDNDNLTQSLDTVGISVNEGGKLRVNESRLADALSENSSNVTAVLGQSGLAGRMSRNVDLANFQRENLFPTVTDYAGDKRDEPTESLYAVQNNRTAAHSKENAGYFLNMFT